MKRKIIMSLIAALLVSSACKKAAQKKDAKVNDSVPAVVSQGDTIKESKPAALPAPLPPPPPAPAVAEKVEVPSEPVKKAPDVPANARTVGKFTVFTVPSSPTPNDPYVIFVKLEPGFSAYRADDLSLHIVGADGYEVFFSKGEAFSFEILDEFYEYEADSGDKVGLHPEKDLTQILKFERKFEFFGVAEKAAYLGIHMPASPVGARDTIKISSRVLNSIETIALDPP